MEETSTDLVCLTTVYVKCLCKSYEILEYPRYLFRFPAFPHDTQDKFYIFLRPIFTQVFSVNRLLSQNKQQV